jgi:hypothetical protein
MRPGATLVRVRVLVGAAVLATACHDGPSGHDGFDEICGAAAAARLLELEPDEHVDVVGRVGDDVIVSSYQVDGDDRAVDGSSQTRVVDLCGGRVAPFVFESPYAGTWGDVVTACSDDGDFVQLADARDTSPEILVRGACAARSDDDALLLHRPIEGDAALADIVELRRVDGATLTTVLIAGVSYDGDGVVFLDDHEVFAKMPDGTVRSFDRITRTGRIELEGGHLVGAEPELLLYTPDDDERTLILRRRDSGAEQVLAELPAGRTVFITAATIALVSVQFPDESEWFARSDGHAIEPPVGTTIVGTTDDGELWLERSGASTSFFRWREGAAPQHVITCDGCYLPAPWFVGPVGVTLAFPTNVPWQSELWVADPPAFEARRVASRVGSDFVRSADGSLLTTLAPSHGDGALLRYDGDAAAPLTIATQVYAGAAWLDAYYDVDGEVVYERDAVGDHALYRVALAQ